MNGEWVTYRSAGPLSPDVLQTFSSSIPLPLPAVSSWHSHAKGKRGRNFASSDKLLRVELIAAWPIISIITGSNVFSRSRNTSAISKTLRRKMRGGTRQLPLTRGVDVRMIARRPCVTRRAPKSAERCLRCSLTSNSGKSGKEKRNTSQTVNLITARECSVPRFKL